MDGSLLFQSLRDKGWIQHPDGTWSRPEQRRLSPAAGKAKPAKQKKKASTYNLVLVMEWFRSHGLPTPRPEYAFHPERKWRFDFAWIEQQVALEVEGGIFTGGAHGSIGGALRDIEKYSEAAAYGWRILRCLPQNLCTSEVAALVKRALNCVASNQIGQGKRK